MIKKQAVLMVVLLTCLAPLSSFADKVGDPARPLVIKEWTKGNPVEIKAGTNIYVVEFWAALSPASRDSIPKLNELQKKFKDKGVVVLGISDEPADKVRGFVELGPQVDYTVAADDHRGTAMNYMVAYGQNGIPHVFIVGRDAKVLWHGHPQEGLEQALEQITAGKYDLQRAMKLDAIRAELDEYRIMARKGDPKAKELGKKLLADRATNVVLLCDFAYRIVSDVRNTNRDFALAEEALNRADKVAPTNAGQVLVARGVLLFERGKQDEGIALAKKALDLAKDDKEKASIASYIRVMEGRKESESKAQRKSKQMPPGPAPKAGAVRSSASP
jgi:tetratricopeptide (TPR) repeat protein